MDVEAHRSKLISEQAALLAQDANSEADCASVTLEQDSVGRLSRIAAMQVQAMAMAIAQQRRRRQDLGIDM